MLYASINTFCQLYGNQVLDLCRACTALTDIDAPWVMEGHTHLTPGLVRAHLAMHTDQSLREPEIGGMVWLSLQSLTIHATDMDVYHIARLIRQAPQLQSLCVVCTAVYLLCVCEARDSQSLVQLHRKCNQGLQLSVMDGAGQPVEMHLVLHAAHPSGAYFAAGHELHGRAAASSLEPMLCQLATSCPITFFSKLTIEDALPGHSVHLLHKIFPEITSLTLCRYEIHEQELPALASLSSVTELIIIQHNTYLPPESLAGLCLKLPSLKRLVLERCRGIDRMVALSIQGLVGAHVELVHDTSRAQVWSAGYN